MHNSWIETLGILSIVWCLCLVWVAPVLWLIQLITPKKIVDRYFKQPHFNLGETIVLATFPGSLFRTAILLSSCVSERHRRGRQLENYLTVVPRWYVRIAWIYVPLLVFHFFSVIILLGIVLLWPEP